MRCSSSSQFVTLILHATAFSTAVLCSVEFGVCLNRRVVPDSLTIALFGTAFLGQVILSALHAVRASDLRRSSAGWQTQLMDASPVGPLECWSIDISQPAFPDGELVFK